MGNPETKEESRWSQQAVYNNNVQTRQWEKGLLKEDMCDFLECLNQNSPVAHQERTGASTQKVTEETVSTSDQRLVCKENFKGQYFYMTTAMTTLPSCY